MIIMKQLNTKYTPTFAYFSSIFLGLALCTSIGHAADAQLVAQSKTDTVTNEQTSTLKNDDMSAASNKPLHQSSSVEPTADVMQSKMSAQKPVSVPEQNESEKIPAGSMEMPENKIVIVSRPQVSGLWGMTIPGAKCLEYYNFMENGDVVIKSDKEWTYGKYIYQVPTQPEPGLPVLVMQIKYDNLEADCSGNAVDQRGEQQQQYVKWTGTSSMEFCGTQEGTQCFASLRRVLP